MKTISRSDYSMIGAELLAPTASLVDLSSPDRMTLAGITFEGADAVAQIKATLVDQAATILAAHGARAFEAPKEAAALHEAGHVIIAATLGKRLKRSHIRQHERVAEAWIGLTEFANKLYLNRPRRLMDYARFVFAGLAAETLFDPDFREGSSLDELLMSQLLASEVAERSGITDKEAHWHREVVAVTRAILLRHERAVREIAAHLHEHHELRGRALTQMTAGIGVAMAVSVISTGTGRCE